LTASAIIEAIHADVKAHARGAEPSDDITLLVLAREQPYGRRRCSRFYPIGRMTNEY